jgi:glycosyltransferase involved in cell wall biosynthesis
MPVSQKNKILFVCNSSWGVVKFRINTINALIDEGYRIIVLAPEDSYSSELIANNRIQFVPLKNLDPSGLSPVKDLSLYREFKRRYAELKPDLIFHYTIKPNIYGTRAAAKLKIPSVSVVTGLGYAFINKPLLGTFASFLYKRSLPLAAETWFLNLADQDFFTSRSIVSVHKTFILPGEGVDTEKYNPGYFEGHSNISVEPQNQNITERPNPINFLLIGRLIKEKGILEFAEAAQILKVQGLDCKFSILGFTDDANPSAISREIINDWKLSGIINYLGSSDDVRPYIMNADCIVLPSYREGMPLSLLEASAMAKPLIATDTPGCSDIIKDGINGFLCKPGNAVSLAEAMKKMATLNETDRNKMGQQGRKIAVEQFNAGIIKNIYLQKIRALIH